MKTVLPITNKKSGKAYLRIRKKRDYLLAKEKIRSGKSNYQGATLKKVFTSLEFGKSEVSIY